MNRNNGQEYANVSLEMLAYNIDLILPQRKNERSFSRICCLYWFNKYSVSYVIV